MEFCIQLQLRVLSILDTISSLGCFGIERARSTVHNWVQKADLQLIAGKQPDHVALEETVIRLDEQRYWLNAAVDPVASEFFPICHSPTRNEGGISIFLSGRTEKHDVENAVFSSIPAHSSTQHSIVTDSDFDTKNTAVGTLPNASLRR